jgi:hypothetical protein
VADLPVVNSASFRHLVADEKGHSKAGSGHTVTILRAPLRCTASLGASVLSMVVLCGQFCGNDRQISVTRSTSHPKASKPCTCLHRLLDPSQRHPLSGVTAMDPDHQPPAERPVSIMTAHRNVARSSDALEQLLPPPVSVENEECSSQDRGSADTAAGGKWWEMHHWQRSSILKYVHHHGWRLKSITCSLITFSQVTCVCGGHRDRRSSVCGTLIAPIPCCAASSCFGSSFPSRQSYVALNLDRHCRCGHGWTNSARGAKWTKT